LFSEFKIHLKQRAHGSRGEFSKWRHLDALSLSCILSESPLLWPLTFAVSLRFFEEGALRRFYETRGSKTDQGRTYANFVCMRIKIQSRSKADT
jgi:hypothetical protein